MLCIHATFKAVFCVAAAISGAVINHVYTYKNQDSIGTKYPTAHVDFQKQQIKEPMGIGVKTTDNNGLHPSRHTARRNIRFAHLRKKKVLTMLYFCIQDPPSGLKYQGAQVGRAKYS